MKPYRKKSRNVVKNLLEGVCFSESASVLVRHLSRFDSGDFDFLIITTDEDMLSADESRKYDLILCVPLLNSFPDVNDILSKIHRLLKKGGVLVGKVDTLETKRLRVVRKRGRLLYACVFVFDFLFRRFLLGILGQGMIVRRLGLRKHRIMSKCEALGRLRYCGYDILHLQESTGYLCFVSRSSTAPMNGDPCEGLFIKIRKQGLRGQDLYTYKLRTMHPYANYLHDYILENLDLDNNGKVVDDFRVPLWGKMIRRSWIDELPQLLNILKGELSFIGVRHLSKEFLELYPKRWREERMKVRPGFVPPYYADCPRTFEGIIDSEKRYCKLRKRHPLTTDIYYFVRVVINFLTMRARTG
jgi:SAM-dependent methyltransferase